MSGRVSERKRLVRVSASNLAQGTLCIRGHLDFFPDDFARRDGKAGRVDIRLGGSSTRIDIGLKPGRDGRASSFSLAGGEPFKSYYARSGIMVGDVVALERLAGRRYRLYAFTKTRKADAGWRDALARPLESSSPTVLELFAGCGGLGLGFKRAGFAPILAVEWDRAACDSLRANVTSRVAQCAVEEITRFPKADVVIGGPPCQGFSNLGERVPFDPRRQLWRQFLRAVKEAAPHVFVMENVAPLLSSQEFVEIERAATDMGYGIRAAVLNAADFGTPQIRKRAIIIGRRGAVPEMPTPTHGRPGATPETAGGPTPWRTVRQAIGDLPLQPDGVNWHVGRNPTAKSKERYRFVPEGGNRWNLPDRLMPECWRRKTEGGTDLFGRLWWDRPSVTIRTEFYKPEKGRYLHPVADRPITHREAARLQGFSDDFVFVGSKIEVGKQIGNAVPPSLAAAIAGHVMTYVVDQPGRLDTSSRRRNSHAATSAT